MTEELSKSTEISNRTVALISISAAVVYFFSNPNPQLFYDYTFRVAGRFLQGGVGVTDTPPSWLNEFVLFEGVYYSVFPLGSVLTMIPFALLKLVGAVDEMPAALAAAICAAGSCLFLLLIARRYGVSRERTVMMPLGFLFGTWAWTNLTFGGAWQLALGFAMLGELGAIYFTICDRRPIVAGIFFALGFGNRTEVLLTAPVFYYFLYRRGTVPDPDRQSARPDNEAGFKAWLPSWLGFSVFPFMLGLATLIYNWIRFHSIFDFGYARIPGVLDEPWYDHGIFSPYYIPRQVWETLFKMWEFRQHFPLPIPNGFSSSVLISSPFLIFAVRPGGRHRAVKYACWAAVLVLCVLLWTHGNSGGWQFGYRYAIVCLPWLFVIMLENAPARVTPVEWGAYVFSFVVNAYATWLFHWTGNIKP